VSTYIGTRARGSDTGRSAAAGANRTPSGRRGTITGLARPADADPAGRHPSSSLQSVARPA
jgi:hypothetical protein